MQWKSWIWAADAPAKKPKRWGYIHLKQQGERRHMKPGTTVGCMAVFAGVLLATITSVSANHAATGKGTYMVPPQVLFQLHFVVASPGLNVMQSEGAQSGISLSFQTTAIDPFSISTGPAGRTVTITGSLVSTTILGEGPDRQAFAELVPFIAIGVDTDTAPPVVGADSFSLTLTYGAGQTQGPLFASIEFGACEAVSCTITFAGPMETGDIFVHTSGDE
jgi:hypothetical protein